MAKAAAEPPAATHRPGPPRATTMESPPSTLMLRVSWMSRYAEKPRAPHPAMPISQRAACPPRTRCQIPAAAMRIPAAARIRPLMPRVPGMPMSPANVSTQGSSAPVTMAAPAAIVVSAAAVCQLRSRAACRERSAVGVVRVVMAVGPNASGAGTGGAAR